MPITQISTKDGRIGLNDLLIYKPECVMMYRLYFRRRQLNINWIGVIEDVRSIALSQYHLLVFSVAQRSINVNICKRYYSIGWMHNSFLEVIIKGWAYGLFFEYIVVVKIMTTQQCNKSYDKKHHVCEESRRVNVHTFYYKLDVYC